MDKLREVQWVRVGPNGRGSGDHFIMDAQGPSQVPARIVLPGKRFIALVIWDCEAESTDEIKALGESLVASGLSYACCYGKGAGRMEGAVDTAAVDRLLDRSSREHQHISTTSHEDESLDDALWFFLHSAWSPDSHSDKPESMLVLQIGATDEVASRVKFALTHPATFEEQVCPGEP